MEDLLVRYGIVLGKRYSLKQRQRFLLGISEEFSALGYSVKFANNDRKGNARAVDLFIGDIGEASTIICTHHDTPQKVLWPNYHYYPLNGQRSFKNYWLVTLIPGLSATAFGALAIYGILTHPEIGGAFRPLWLVVIVGLAILLATIISNGLANKYNINRNTAGILAMLEIAKELAAAKTKNVAFILLDKGCSDNSGTQMLKQALPTTMDKKLFIYLDCIGNGEHVVLGYKENLAMEAKRMLKEFDGTQAIETLELDEGNVVYTAAYFFKRSIVVTNGLYDRQGMLYVPNTCTGKDKYADISTIRFIAQMLARFLKK